MGSAPAAGLVPPVGGDVEERRPSSRGVGIGESVLSGGDAGPEKSVLSGGGRESMPKRVIYMKTKEVSI